MPATYGPDDFGRCQVHRSGYPLLYRVHARGGTRWLRVYSPGHPSVHRLKAQAAAVAALAHAGARVARPIRDMSALDQIDYDYLVEHPLKRLAPHRAARAVMEEVRNIANDVRDRLPQGVPIGLCHGDIHPPNVHINDDGTATLLDFDELARGPLSYDLACYWRKSVLENKDRAAADREWHAFVEGYEAIRTVSADERRAIPVLATLRAIWTMAMPADYAGIWGEDWLTDPTYFSSHLEMTRRFGRETRTTG